VAVVQLQLLKPVAKADRYRSMVRVYVGLGANLGDPLGAVKQAVGWLESLPGTTRVAVSEFYGSAPWQAQGPDYVNAVVALDTSLTAPDLLDELQRLEALAGRERPYHHAPRTLDLDLLLYGTATVQSPRLTVPHPHVWDRAFVLFPLADVAPQLVSAEALAAVAGQSVYPLPKDERAC
jgi:2-amino-4-hydroxy-6-hydroxymethyldihydropteridine diphosphokinase